MFGGFSPSKLLKLAAVAMLATAVSEQAFAKVTSSSTAKAAGVQDLEPLVLEPSMSHARVHFRRHDYRSALLALGKKTEEIDALFIAAESNFRLNNFDEARRLYELIVEKTQDQIERRKAHIRLFDIEIAANNAQHAINRYVAFGKEYGKPTALMRYSLGKALYDIGYLDRAEKILRGVPKDSEFFIRARYMIASMGMDKRKPEALVRIFGQIEALPPVSVEDYAVRQLAILAQGRIYAQARKEDQAVKAYARVNLAGEFGETATIEAVRTMLYRASEARIGEGRFKRASAFIKAKVQKDALSSALSAIERYRKAYEIDWRKPELLTLMARLYVEAKRYEEARLAYQELIGHYRPLYDSLLQGENNNEVWPFFALDFASDSKKRRATSLIVGIPGVMAHDIPEVREILVLRDRIEDSEKWLRDLEDRSYNLKLNPGQLAAERSRQNGIMTAYNTMVIKKQNGFRKAIANNLNKSLAEAEFQRAELVVTEMRDLKTQQKTVHDYQSEKIDAFENDLKKLDEGGST